VPSIADHHVTASELVTTGALDSHSSKASTGADLSFNVLKYLTDSLVIVFSAHEGNH
jgi:hypothetical protein